MSHVLGLPDGVHGCLFDLDGVLTDTASVHNAAWTSMFDDYLRARAASTGQPYVPFDPAHDYLTYVDGKPRTEGVRDFLASRGITLPEGTPDDPPATETLCGLGNRKNEVVQHQIDSGKVTVFDGSRRYLLAVADAGLRRAVVSSSANTRRVLEVTGLAPYVELVVDGVTISEQHLHGKPAPDTFLVAAQQLGLEPASAAVFEDALAGVAAGHAGRFGYVVGVDRVGQAAELRADGADVVVRDLAELLDGSRA